MDNGVKITRPVPEAARGLFAPQAQAFVADLHRRFDGRRLELLARRQRRAVEIDGGALPDFLDETRTVREAAWTVAPAPADLDDRRVEITGPASDRKMMINAFNSGAKVYMADLEDSMAPTWANVVEAQSNLHRAVRRQLDFVAPNGKAYRVGESPATLVVRPRGWHLPEKHVLVDGEPVAGALLDFGLFFFHNARELLERGSGPYFYLPKLESHLEARLWNDVFVAAQEALDIPAGTIRATVLIETLLAAFEMDEILYELRLHAAGLNAGRWDYIFSAIRNFRGRHFTFPDRGQITMAVPFMKAYAELLVKTCHHRGAHAIGGMSAFIPSRRDEEVNRVALAKVREDKKREAAAGSDGSWVAHPDLVPVVREIFDAVLGDRPHQKGRQRQDVSVSAADLQDFHIEGGTVSEDGVRTNISVALQYIDAWLQGVGAAAISNLMEDAATAEISRAQLWQWIHWRAETQEGQLLDAALFRHWLRQELAALGGAGKGRLGRAAELLEDLVLAEDFPEFLTLEAYGDLS